MKKYYLVIVLSLLVSACGFSLRGNYHIPESVKTIHLQSFDERAELALTLQRQLTLYGIELLDQTNAVARQVPVLRLLNDKLDRSNMSLFSTGQVAEYELIYTVNYQIIFPDKEPVDFTLELFRDYQDDPTAVLAKSRELELLLSELRTQAVDRIMRQLAQFES